MPANLSSLTRRSVPAVSAAAGAASLGPRHLPAADSAPRGQQSNRSQPEGLTRDDILDNITLYGLTKTGVFSARLSWENKLDFFAPKHVTLPVAVSVFPDEMRGPAQRHRRATWFEPQQPPRTASAALPLKILKNL